MKPFAPEPFTLYDVDRITVAMTGGPRPHLCFTYLDKDGREQEAALHFKAGDEAYLQDLEHAINGVAWDNGRLTHYEERILVEEGRLPARAMPRLAEAAE